MELKTEKGEEIYEKRMFLLVFFFLMEKRYYGLKKQQ